MALGFSLVATLITGLAIGLLPVLQASGVNVLEALKEAGRGSVGSGRRLRAGLLVAEVSLSLVLLIAAGLLLTSFVRLQRVEPGFEPEGIFTAQLVLPAQRYPIRIECSGQTPVIGEIQVPAGKNERNFDEVVTLKPPSESPVPR